MHRSNSSNRCLGLVSPPFPSKRMRHQFNTVAHTCQKYRKTFQWSSMWKWKPEHCRKSMFFFLNDSHDSIFMVRMKHQFTFYSFSWQNSTPGPLKNFYLNLFIRQNLSKYLRYFATTDFNCILLWYVCVKLKSDGKNNMGQTTLLQKNT